jgi:hypothetical protein
MSSILCEFSGAKSVDVLVKIGEAVSDVSREDVELENLCA